MCLKWYEKKRSVTMMSTVHSAVYVEVKKRHLDDKIMKPLAVYDYTQKMAGIDKHDQFNTYYNPPRRSLKWTTKMSFHLLSMCMTNAYILYTTYGPNGTKLDHKEFILSVANSSQFFSQFYGHFLFCTLCRFLNFPFLVLKIDFLFGTQ